jgi:predicted small lipoprotein YifL
MNGVTRRHILLAATLLSVAACGRAGGAPVETGPSAVAPTQQPVVPSTSLPPPTPITSSPASATSPVMTPPAAVASFLAEEGSLALEALPSHAPPAAVSAEEAVATALKELNIDASVEPAYVARGLGTIIPGRKETVWLVVVKTPDQALVPFPVGPRCPDNPNGQCAQSWAVNEWGIAMVSDQTGKLLVSEAIMREMDAPASASP